MVSYHRYYSVSKYLYSTGVEWKANKLNIEENAAYGTVQETIYAELSK